MPTTNDQGRRNTGTLSVFPGQTFTVSRVSDFYENDWNARNNPLQTGRLRISWLQLPHRTLLSASAGCMKTLSQPISNERCPSEKLTTAWTSFILQRRQTSLLIRLFVPTSVNCDRLHCGIVSRQTSIRGVNVTELYTELTYPHTTVKIVTCSNQREIWLPVWWSQRFNSK